MLRHFLSLCIGLGLLIVCWTGLGFDQPASAQILARAHFDNQPILAEV